MPPPLPPPDTSHSHDQDSDPDADILTIPFTQQRGYGSGLSKRPISFVSATPTPTGSETTSATPACISSQYLSLISSSSKASTPSETPTPTYDICPTCNAPIKEATPTAHYLSFAHQHALPPAPTPSGIDRSRMGLKYLTKHGFDVDKRTGLGKSEQGIAYPVRAVEKRDKSGIGVGKAEEEVKDGAKKAKVVEKKVERLDAGKIRKLAQKDKKKMERLRREFYQDEKVTKYLGELGG